MKPIEIPNGYLDPFVALIAQDSIFLPVLLRSLPVEIFSLICNYHGFCAPQIPSGVVTLFEETTILGFIRQSQSVSLRTGLKQRLELIRTLKSEYPLEYYTLESIPLNNKNLPYTVVAAPGWNPYTENNFDVYFDYFFFAENPDVYLQKNGSFHGLTDCVNGRVFSTLFDIQLKRTLKKEEPEPISIPLEISNKVVEILLEVKNMCLTNQTGEFLDIRRCITYMITKTIKETVPICDTKTCINYRGLQNIYFSTVVQMYIQATCGGKSNVLHPYFSRASLID